MISRHCEETIHKSNLRGSPKTLMTLLTLTFICLICPPCVPACPPSPYEPPSLCPNSQRYWRIWFPFRVWRLLFQQRGYFQGTHPPRVCTGCSLQQRGPMEQGTERERVGSWGEVHVTALTCTKFKHKTHYHHKPLSKQPTTSSWQPTNYLLHCCFVLLYKLITSCLLANYYILKVLLKSNVQTCIPIPAQEFWNGSTFS